MRPREGHYGRRAGDGAAAAPPRPGPPLPRDYVSLAQLQEQRRLKLERQRKEEEEQAAARLRKQRGEEEEERLPRLKVEGEEEREVDGWLDGGRAVLVRARRGWRWGPTHWRPKNGGGSPGAEPEARAEGGSGDASVGGGGEEGERGVWRGRTTGEPRQRNRSGDATASECRESGAGGATAEGSVATGVEGDPHGRSETEGREDVKPCPIVDVEEGRNGQPEKGCRVLDLELEEKQENVGLALSCGGQEGTRVTRNGFQSTAGKVCWRAKLSNPLETNCSVDVACKIKDLSIIRPERDEVAMGDGKGSDYCRRRPRAGRKGGYPTFRTNGAFGPRRWSRPAGDRMTWVRKTESS